jgi:hypothetical protein
MANYLTQTGYSNPWYSEPEVTAEQSMTVGTGESPPVVSDTNGPSPFNLRDFLGSIGTAARNVGSTARDIGTAVGTVRASTQNAQNQYRDAQSAAADTGPGAKLRQWWVYAPTSEKVMAGLALAGLAIALVQLTKK